MVMVKSPGQKFSEQQRVAIDRLRQDARQRALIALAVDQVEADADGNQRDQEREHRNERGQAFARAGKKAQEQERVLGRNFADLLDAGVDYAERHQDDQPFQHDHPDAGQVVGQLLEGYDAKTLKGRAFTLHDALLLWRLLLPGP